jgi:hypothetical protein
LSDLTEKADGRTLLQEFDHEQFNTPSLDAATCGMGFGGLALANLLGNTASAEETGGACGLIFPVEPNISSMCFLNGGVSQVDTFDPKPELTRLARQDAAV